MSVYDDLEILNGGVLFERAVERDLVRLFEDYAVAGEGLDGAKVHVSVRGIPLIFGEVDAEDDVMKQVRARSSYVVVVASNFLEVDGANSCDVRVVVASKVHDGEVDEQVRRHERWCAAVRGIMSEAALKNGVGDHANQCAQEVEFCGWERDGQPVTDQWVRDQWVHEETFTVRGVLR